MRIPHEHSQGLKWYDLVLHVSAPGLVHMCILWFSVKYYYGIAEYMNKLTLWPSLVLSSFCCFVLENLMWKVFFFIFILRMNEWLNRNLDTRVKLKKIIFNIRICITTPQLCFLHASLPVVYLLDSSDDSTENVSVTRLEIEFLI